MHDQYIYVIVVQKGRKTKNKNVVFVCVKNYKLDVLLGVSYQLQEYLYTSMKIKLEINNYRQCQTKGQLRNVRGENGVLECALLSYAILTKIRVSFTQNFLKIKDISCWFIFDMLSVICKNMWWYFWMHCATCLIACFYSDIHKNAESYIF